MKELKSLGTLWPGSRIGIMLIHGLTGTPTELSVMARDLNGYGFTVFCPLLAGHCVSEAELLKTNWQDWYDSVKTALNAFSKHVDVIFSGGISAGAVLSLKLAQDFPEQLRGLVLYSTTLWWDGWATPKLSFILPFVLRLPYIGKRWRFKEAWPYGIKNERLRERVRLKMQNGDPSEAGFSGMPGFSLRELWRLVDLVKEKLPQIKIPVLLIHARDDELTSIRNAIYIKNRVGGTKRLIAMENSYHMITIDQERHQVSRQTACYFFGQLSRQEQDLLTACASLKMIETLSQPYEYKELSDQELLAGISKRRNWIK